MLNQVRYKLIANEIVDWKKKKKKQQSHALKVENDVLFGDIIEDD